MIKHNNNYNLFFFQWNDTSILSKFLKRFSPRLIKKFPDIETLDGIFNFKYTKWQESQKMPIILIDYHYLIKSGTQGTSLKMNTFRFCIRCDIMGLCGNYNWEFLRFR